MAPLIERRGNGFALSRNLAPRLVAVAACKPLGRETRKHPPHQVAKLAASLERFGFVVPILVDADGRVVAGWGLVLAARRLGLSEVPAVTLTDLADAELRALRLALNRLADDAVWDPAALSLELSDILQIDSQVEVEITGFESGEIEGLMGGSGIDQEDELPEVENGTASVTQLGDLWTVGEHHLYCGDALDPDSYARVLGTDQASMAFIDPPYNVPVAGHVSGLGAVKHGDFAMGAGELSSTLICTLLEDLPWRCGNAVHRWCHPLCLHGLATPARAHGCRRRRLQRAQRTFARFPEKSNAGMGSLYRSKHELIFVFKVGKKPHVNNVALGKWGRHRTNVWDCT